METLQMLKIAEIRVEFSGGGDSGDINDIVFLDVNGNPIEDPGDNVHVKLIQNFAQFDHTGKWEDDAEYKLVPLKAAVEAMFYTIDGFAGLDWCNNDGGQGTMTFEVKGGQLTIKHEVGTNYTATEDHTFEY